MFEKDIVTLHKQVMEFKRFQKKYYPQMTEENDNGEWEIGLRQWNEMNSTYLKIIENYIPESIEENLIDDMLYVIARDSECSHLLIKTLQYPQWFEVLCRHSIATDYYNARWQFAEQIGNYKGESDIKNLLFCFIESKDEYTERMALQSLCEHFPEQAESYAVKFWNRNVYKEDEYQKIMALYVLHKINSPLLEEYAAKAYEMEYCYLKEWANKYVNEVS
ncbi:MAG: hypothetical protein HFI70_07320 [Lachnospiraceae bacterium]|nr:hypothetical protein [Lachnospiraceae bacterium]